MTPLLNHIFLFKIPREMIKRTMLLKIDDINLTDLISIKFIAGANIVKVNNRLLKYDFIKNHIVKLVLFSNNADSTVLLLGNTDNIVKDNVYIKGTIVRMNILIVLRNRGSSSFS